MNNEEMQNGSSTVNGPESPLVALLRKWDAIGGDRTELAVSLLIENATLTKERCDAAVLQRLGELATHYQRTSYALHMAADLLMAARQYGEQLLAQLQTAAMQRDRAELRLGNLRDVMFAHDCPRSFESGTWEGRSEPIWLNIQLTTFRDLLRCMRNWGMPEGPGYDGPGSEGWLHMRFVEHKQVLEDRDELAKELADHKAKEASVLDRMVAFSDLLARAKEAIAIHALPELTTALKNLEKQGFSKAHLSVVQAAREMLEAADDLEYQGEGFFNAQAHLSAALDAFTKVEAA